MKTAQLPLDFSLNVKTDGAANLNIHVKTNENTSSSMLISSDKNSQSAFKVVTPKHADGMSINSALAFSPRNANELQFIFLAFQTIAAAHLVAF